MTTNTVALWIIHHMAESYDYRPQPKTVKVMEDPKVRGTFAARFVQKNDSKYAPGKTVDLLFITSQAPNADDPNDPASVLEATLEEVEYKTWPPISDGLQFFT